MMKRAMVDDYRGLNYYRKLHFIPCDLEEESVSKTFEHCYDDWSIAHVTRKLGIDAGATMLLNRSLSYRNYFDTSTTFMRPKFADGAWANSTEGKGAVPFNPVSLGHLANSRDYTESNAWQTNFASQHDVAGTIALFGGRVPSSASSTVSLLLCPPCPPMRRLTSRAWSASMPMATSLPTTSPTCTSTPTNPTACRATKTLARWRPGTF
jgi:hypothetical protein